MAQDEREALEQLNSIRQSIDNIDAALIHLLAERFKFTQQVGRLKAVHGLPPSDPERESRQTQRLRTLAEGAHLDPAFAEKWFNFVVAEVIQHHEEIAGSSANGAAARVAPAAPATAPAVPAVPAPSAPAPSAPAPSAPGTSDPGPSAPAAANVSSDAIAARPTPHPGVHPVPRPSPSRPTP
jgi:chorismate mutase